MSNYKDCLRSHGNVEIKYFGGPADGIEGWLMQHEADSLDSPIVIRNKTSGFLHQYDVVVFPGEHGNILHCYHEAVTK